jgi:hypothetical protein
MSHDVAASGSRWEPAAPTTSNDPGTELAPDARRAGGDEPTTAVSASAPRPSSTRGRRRGRRALAAGAAGLLLVGGAGGFAIGRATATTIDPAATAGAVGHRHGDEYGSGRPRGDDGSTGPGGAGAGSGPTGTGRST